MHSLFNHALLKYFQTMLEKFLDFCFDKVIFLCLKSKVKKKILQKKVKKNHAFFILLGAAHDK